MSYNGTFVILPVEWGSKGISLPEWLSLLTLGLAPLIVHIIAGAPRPSYLCHSRPKWHDTICILNPTSILWRYAAITDRRIRSRVWTVVEVAASNAVFWTPSGWDGTEAMIMNSLPYATRLPEKPRVHMFSVEMGKTIVTVLQGIQAFASLLGLFTHQGDSTTMDAVSGLFIPIALCGLLRLFPARWLTDDFYYTVGRDDRMLRYSGMLEPWMQRDTAYPGVPQHYPPRDGMYPGMSEHMPQRERRHSVDSLIEHPIGDVMSPTHGGMSSLREPLSIKRLWLSAVFKMFYMVPFLCAWTLAFLFITPWISTVNTPGVWSLSSYMLGLFYMAVLTPSIAIYTFYFIKGETTTTIIPCISSRWYKAYSVYVLLNIVALVTISSIETRRAICGKYTAMPEKYGDPCATGDTKLLHVAPGGSITFGLAQNLTAIGQFAVANFTGTCLGTLAPADEAQGNATFGSIG
jgi:hypothetical protein